MGLALGFTQVAGQITTERYIPVGQSPGLSGVVTFVGQIESVDAQGRSYTVQNEAEARTVRLDDRTHIWLDRSSLRQASATGSASDLRTGVTVEIRYRDDDRGEPADWVKVAVTGG